MKRYLLGLAALLAFNSAQAADMPLKAMTKPIPATSWTGFYVGANVGGVWGSFDNRLTTVNGPPGDQFFNTAIGQDRDVNAAGTGSANSSGFTGGVQAGYNKQMDRIVLGIEADFGAMSLKPQRGGVFPYTGLINHPFSLNTSAKTDWLLTVRGRVGYAVDRTLLYATGGLAVTELRFNQNFQDLVCQPLPACTESIAASSTRVGYTVGAGVEHMFDRNWTAKAEYLYLNFDTGNFSGLLGTPVVGTGVATFNNSTKLDAHVFRVGVNYLFGSGPVVAKY